MTAPDRPARRALRRSVALAALITTGACGQGRDAGAPAGSQPSESVEGSPDASTAVVGVAAAATTVLPPLAAAALDFEIGGVVFLGLNYGKWADGELAFEPGHPLGLARRWKVDGPRLTYHLDAERTWSDGVAITAEDVRFTFELLADESLALPLGAVTERLDSVSVADDSTVVFHFAAEYPGMLFDTGVGILPAHVFADVDRAQMTGGLPLGAESGIPASGPFRLAEWTPAERIVLERNEFSPARAGLDRLVIRVIPDETTRLAELRAGGIDAAQLNSFRSVRLAAEAGLTTDAIPQRGYDYIAWNPGGHPAFESRDVRRALSLALDRETAIAALDMTGFAEPAWGPYGSLFAPLRSGPPSDRLFDPDGAAAALDAAGWSDSDGDGIRDREGTPLAFELALPSGNDRREDAAELIRENLARVGVAATVRQQEFNSLLNRLVGGDYEAAIMGWQVGLDPDISMFWSDPGLPLNVVAYSEPAALSAIRSARAATSAADAAEHWRAAGARIAEDYPYAFLWFFDMPFVSRPELEGVRVTPSGWGAQVWEWRRTP